MNERPRYLSSKEAAEYLGYADKSLRQSRVKGKLAGITTPPYYKVGHRVRYKAVDLDNWLAVWQPITNTCQSSVDPKLRTTTTVSNPKVKSPKQRNKDEILKATLDSHFL